MAYTYFFHDLCSTKIGPGHGLSRARSVPIPAEEVGGQEEVMGKGDREGGTEGGRERQKKKRERRKEEEKARAEIRVPKSVLCCQTSPSACYVRDDRGDGGGVGGDGGGDGQDAVVDVGRRTGRGRDRERQEGRLLHHFSVRAAQEGEEELCK